MVIKDIIAATRYQRAVSKVDKAVHEFASRGIGYSPMEGIVGDISKYSKSEQKKITAAATTMSEYHAGYYPTRQRFTANTPLPTAHYSPLSTADYRFAQEHVYTQSHHSGHLRAPQTFIKRICFDARIQSHPNRRLLKLDPAAAQEWSAFTESLWRLDKKSKDWDYCRSDNYMQLADQALSLYLSPGECFVVRRQHFNDDTRLPGISLQLIHPYQVQSPTFGVYFPVPMIDVNTTVKIDTRQSLHDLQSGHYIDSGIEYDAQDNEVAIFIAPAGFNDPWTRVPVYSPTGFQQVLHCFIKKTPGEKRGIPESAYSWHEYMNIADMEKFELESARLNTVIAGSVTSDSGAMPNGKNPMKSLGDVKTGWANLEDPEGSGEEISPNAAPGYSIRKVTEGGFILQHFTPGYKYTELNTTRPNINIPEYIEKLLEFLYPADYGVSVVCVKQRFDGSYNASKGAIDLTWKNSIEFYLKQFESDFHYPNYGAWLNAKIAAGIVTAPGWDKAQLRAAWCDMSVITPPKPSLNPAAEATAATTRCDGLFSNREYEAQQITGTSAEENAERLMFENAALAKARNVLEPAQLEQGGTTQNE